MARVYTRERRRRRRARLPPPARPRRERRPGLEAVRDVGGRLHDRLQRLPLRAAAAAGPSLPQSRPPAGGAVGRRAEHDGELRHEHELAVLRRRGDDVVPQPDGRARGAATSSRPAPGWRCSPRSIRGIARRGGGVGLGNFWRDLYRSIVYILLPLSIVLAVILISQGVRRPSTATRRRRRSRARTRRSRAARSASHDRDQAARDERRRLLQLELGRSVREPDAALELLRDAGDPADPVRAGRDVRADGARAAARVGALRRLLLDLRDRRRRRLPGRAARLAGAARAPA